MRSNNLNTSPKDRSSEYKKIESSQCHTLSRAEREIKNEKEIEKNILQNN
jgi:hypothetical protein